MADRARDWFVQAERDLEQARASRREKRHEWACFAAQQAAQKAVKALHLSRHQEAWGHMIAGLLSELPAEVVPPEDLVEKGKILDGYYIQPRYPDSYPEGAPFEHFGTIQSEESIRYAGQIVEFVRSHLA